MSQTFLEDIPEFLEIQRSSFLRILDNGLIQALEKINPISPTTQCDYGLLFYPKDYVLVLPETTITEAFLQGKTYGCKIYVPAIVYETEKKTSPVLKKKGGVKMSKNQGKGSSGLTSFGLAKKTTDNKDNFGFFDFDNQKQKLQSTSKKPQDKEFRESSVSEKSYSTYGSEEPKLPIYTEGQKSSYQKNKGPSGQFDPKIATTLESNISTYIELSPLWNKTKDGSFDHGFDRSQNLRTKPKNVKIEGENSRFIKTFNKLAWIGPFGPTPLHLLPKETNSILPQKNQQSSGEKVMSKEREDKSSIYKPNNLGFLKKGLTQKVNNLDFKGSFLGSKEMKLHLEPNFEFFSKQKIQNPQKKKESTLSSITNFSVQFPMKTKPTLYGPASKAWSRVAGAQKEQRREKEPLNRVSLTLENPTLFNGNVIFKKKYLQSSLSLLKKMSHFQPNLQSFLKKTIQTPKVTEKALSLLFFSQRWKEKVSLLTQKSLSYQSSKGISQEFEKNVPYKTKGINYPQNLSKVKETLQFATKPKTLLSKSWPFFSKSSWPRTKPHSYGRPFKTKKNDSFANPFEKRGNGKIKSVAQKRVNENITKKALSKKIGYNDHLSFQMLSNTKNLTPSSTFWFKILSFLGSSWSAPYTEGLFQTRKGFLNDKVQLENIGNKVNQKKSFVLSSHARVFAGVRPMTTRSAFQEKGKVHFRSHSWSTVKNTSYETQELQNSVLFPSLLKTGGVGREEIKTLSRKTMPFSSLNIYSKEISIRLALPCGTLEPLTKIQEIKLTTLTKEVKNVRPPKESFLGSKTIKSKLKERNSKSKVLPYGLKGKNLDLRIKGFYQKSKPFGLILRSNFFSSKSKSLDLLEHISKPFEKGNRQNKKTRNNTVQKNPLSLRVLGHNQNSAQTKKSRSGPKAVRFVPRMRLWSSFSGTESPGGFFSKKLEQIKDQNSPFDFSLYSKAKGFMSEVGGVPRKYSTTHIKEKPLSKKEWVCIGLLPLMTPRGHFIINGSHRIVVSQMSRAPGLYYQTGEKLQATIVPSKGAWLRMSIKVNDNGEIKIWVRITPQRKMPYKIFLETYKYLEKLKDQQKDGPPKSKFLNLTYKNINSKIKHFDKHYGIGVISGQISRTLLNLSSYTLGHLGRKRLNERLGTREKKGYITSKDISLIKNNLLKFLDQKSSGSLDDDIDHLENRRVRTTGELLQSEIEVGMTRLKKAIAKQLDDYLNKNTSTFSVREKQTTDNFITKLPLNSNLSFSKNLSQNSKNLGLIWKEGKEFRDLRLETLKKNQKIGNWPQKVGISLNLLYSHKSQGKTKNNFDVKKVQGLNGTKIPFLSPLDLRLETLNRKGVEKLSTKQEKNSHTLWSPSKIVGTKAFAGALREFFGSNPLSQYMDQTNPLAEITHKRRLSSLGPGGVDRASAGIAIRGIHPSHYGRICPIETPEGKNAGLVNSMTMWARINQEGFLETPYIKVQSGSIMSHKKNLSPEWYFVPTKKESRGVETISTLPFFEKTNLNRKDQNLGSFQTLTQNSYARKTKALKIVALDLKISESSFLPNIPLPTRDESERSFGRQKRNVIDFCGVSPTQNISVATSLIPFLEHDDATRALMGSNMQRQAVPLLKAQGPLVRTGLEGKVVGESGHALVGTTSGLISIVTRSFISIDTFSEDHQRTSPLIHTRLNKQKNLHLGWIQSYSDEDLKASEKPLSQLLIFLAHHCKNIAFPFSRERKSSFPESLSFDPVEKNGLDLVKQREIFYNYNCNRPKGNQKGKTIKGNSVQNTIFSEISVKKINQIVRKWQTPNPLLLKNKTQTTRETNALFHSNSFEVTEWLNYGVNKKNLQALKEKKEDLGFNTHSSHSMEQEFSLIPKNFWRQSFKINRERKTQTLQGYTRSNQATICVQRPAVQEGRWIQKGDLIGDCSASRNGVLALGQNIVVAYLPMEGFNFEDAIVVSDRLVREELYTSIHIQRVEFDMDALVKKHIPPKIKVKKQKSAYKTIQQDWITWHNPHLLKSEKENLSSLGIIKVGSWVGPGDVLVSKVFPVERKIAPSRHLLLAVFQEKKTKTLDTDDTSLRVPKGIHGRVINVKIVGNGTIVAPSTFSSISSKGRLNKNLIPSFPKKRKSQFLLSKSEKRLKENSSKIKTSSLYKSRKLYSQNLLFENILTLPEILLKKDHPSAYVVDVKKGKKDIGFFNEKKRKPLQKKSFTKDFRDVFLGEMSSVRENTNNGEKWDRLTKSQRAKRFEDAARPKTVSFQLGFWGPKKPWREFSPFALGDIETLGRPLISRELQRDSQTKGKDQGSSQSIDFTLSSAIQSPNLSTLQSFSDSIPFEALDQKQRENFNGNNFDPKTENPLLVQSSAKGIEKNKSQIEWAKRWINFITSPKSCGYPQSVGFLPTLGSLSTLSRHKIYGSKDPILEPKGPDLKVQDLTQTEKKSRFLFDKESLGVSGVEESRWPKEPKDFLSNFTSSTTFLSTSKGSEKKSLKLRSSKPLSQAQELQFFRVNGIEVTKTHNPTNGALQKAQTSNNLGPLPSRKNSSTFSEKKIDILWKPQNLDMPSKNPLIPSPKQKTKGLGLKASEINGNFYQNKNLYTMKRPLENSLGSLKLKELEIEKGKFEGEYKIVQIRVYIAERKKLQVGDKMSGRHGNKGIVSTILPREDMPYLPDGTPVDMVLNPLGIPSRMNVGQVFECLLGLAASVCGEVIGHTPFDEMYGPEASRSLVYLFLYVARLRARTDWLFQPNFPGKTIVFDGRTGTPFEQWVTVGRAYMLKLIHMVDEKIHARSIGPRSLVTQQPVKGRARGGGQRLGEMELWAFEGFGAAYTLQEILTLKSDDIKGRENVENSIIFATTARAHIPETFRMMLFELRCLCLNVQLNKNS